jgi:hypothetical protein
LRAFVLAALALPLAGLGQLRASPITGFGEPPNSPLLKGATVITFETVPQNSYTTLTISGVTFSTPNSGEVEYISNAYAGNYNTQGQSLQNTYASNAFNKVDFTFSKPVSAFAFNFGASDVNWTLSAYNAQHQLLESLVISPTRASNAGDFFGLADPGITSATLTASSSGDYVFIDNFSFKTSAATGTAVPEPASLALFGLAVVGAAGYRGWRRRSQGASA